LVHLGAAVLLGALFAGSGCSDDDGGGGAAAGKAGADAAVGGAAGKAGSGGTAGKGGTSGTGGASGSPSCPDAPVECSTCQEEDYAGCACKAVEDACFSDGECVAIAQCVYQGEQGVGPCLSFDAAGADCVYACADLHPTGAEKYLAWENCYYCDYCAQSCNTSTYCAALNAGPPDAGPDGAAGSGGAAGDAGTGGAAGDDSGSAGSGGTAGADAAAEAATDAASEAATGDASSDATTE
jgi:hypothetical protein